MLRLSLIETQGCATNNKPKPIDGASHHASPSSFSQGRQNKPPCHPSAPHVPCTRIPPYPAALISLLLSQLAKYSLHTPSSSRPGTAPVTPYADGQARQLQVLLLELDC
jgi:hypothetical protein